MAPHISLPLLRHETRLLGHSSHGRINNKTLARVTHRKGKYSLLKPLFQTHVCGNQANLGSLSLWVPVTHWDSHSDQAVCSMFPKDVTSSPHVLGHFSVT